MRIRLVIGSLIALVAVAPSPGGSPLTTAFTYQGQLKQNGVPADGLYDFRFDLLARDGGARMARTCAFDVEVTHGLFTAEVDFGPTAFEGLALDLQVAVKTDIPGEIEDCSPNTFDPFTPLGPPTPVTAAPYCLHALSAANGHALDAADGSPTDALFVDNIGNVGIGTTNPSRQLEVASPGDTEIGVRSTDTNGRLWSLQSSRVTGGVATDATFQIVDRTAGASRMTIDTVGNVGIGTIAPEAKLHVFGGSAGTVTATANSTVVVEGSGDSFLGVLTPDANRSGIHFGSPGNPQNGGIIFNNFDVPDGLQFRTGGSVTRMTIDSTGVLRMHNSAGVRTARLDPDDVDAAVFVLTNAAGTNTVVLDGEADDTTNPDGGRVSVRNGAGRETVEIDADETGAAALRLSRATGGSMIALGAATSEVILRKGSGTATVVLNGEEGGSFPAGHISVRNSDGTETIEIQGDGHSSSSAGGHILVKDQLGRAFIALVGDDGTIRCTDLQETSTRSMKNDIQPIADALARLVRLQGVEFTWDECVGGRRDLGLIAEEVAEVLPELVRFEEDGVTARGMNYTHLTALIVEAIKELTKEKNEQLRELRAEKDAQIAALKQTMQDLHKQVAALAAEIERRKDQ